MKLRLTRLILGLSMMFAVGAMCTPANAQVVVRVGHSRHYHHRHYHHHPYRR
jgi:hypothetical protein